MPGARMREIPWVGRHPLRQNGQVSQRHARPGRRRRLSVVQVVEASQPDLQHVSRRGELPIEAEEDDGENGVRLGYGRSQETIHQVLQGLTGPRRGSARPFVVVTSRRRGFGGGREATAAPVVWLGEDHLHGDPGVGRAGRGRQA